MTSQKAPEVASHVRFSEPGLLFHANGTPVSDAHPLRGLLKHGPFSSGLVPGPIRIATIAPPGESGQLHFLIGELDSTLNPSERQEYLPAWPGFGNVFGLRLSLAGGNCDVELAPNLDIELRRSGTSHAILADHLVRAIHRLHSVRNEFDVALIYLPRRWERSFKGGPDEDFDLHDHLKATSASLGMPIQLIREDKALAYSCRASVAWRIGLALYAKAGGVPWKLADTAPETAHIGISYAIRQQRSSRSPFVTCCSQVFDAEGAGIEFVAYDTHEFEVRQRNPFLSSTEMFRVMTRSMQLYRRSPRGEVTASSNSAQDD